MAIGRATLWLGLVGMACAPYAPMTELRVDTAAFSETEIEALLDAAHEWCEVSRDTCLPVRLVDRDANVIRLRSLPREWQQGSCAATHHSTRGTRIEVAPDCELTANLAKHEIGHALAGPTDHLPEPGHTMSRSGRANCITDQDAEFVCSRRGCGGEYAGTCHVSE